MASTVESNSRAAGGVIPLIIAVLLAATVGVGAGFGVVTITAPAKNESKASVSRDKVASGSDASVNAGQDSKDSQSSDAQSNADKGNEGIEHWVDPADLGFTALPPVIVNLAEPREVWIRLESGIMYQKSSKRNPDVLAAEAAQQIAQYLKTVRLENIEGPDGMQFLQEDINSMVRTLSEGQVHDVLINGLVVE